MHVITFLKIAKEFTRKHGMTSELTVDYENTVADVLNPAETTGGIIADIQNGITETAWKLREYYERTGNKMALKKLERLFPEP